MENLAFIKDIPNVEELIERIDFNGNDLLRDLMLLILKEGSLNLFISVYEGFQGCQIKFIKKPIAELKKLYVLNRPEENPDKLARIVGLDSRTIYAWKAEMK